MLWFSLQANFQKQGLRNSTKSLHDKQCLCLQLTTYMLQATTFSKAKSYCNEDHLYIDGIKRGK